MIDSLYHLHVNVLMNVNEQIVNAIGSKRSRDRLNQRSKRPRDRLNQRYLWRPRLGHIGEDIINKLKKDGLLGH